MDQGSDMHETEDLIKELTQWQASMARRAKRGHPLVLAHFLAAAVASRDRRLLRAAQAACEALPKNDQRLFRNGWDLDPLRPERDDLLEGYKRKPVRRFLQVDGYAECNDPRCNHVPPGPEACFRLESMVTFDLRHNASPVRVQVLEGSAKDDVLLLLVKIYAKLAADFDRLVTDPVPIGPLPRTVRTASPGPLCSQGDRTPSDDIPF